VKVATRLALSCVLVAGISLSVSHVALAQNTDDAHALCAQGGGPDPGSGAGGSTVNASNPDNPANENAVFGGGQSGTDGGNGGGGSGGGLGGSSDGGGAGGCGPDVPDRTPSPVIVVEHVRRLPTTGTAADRFGLGGAGLLLAGGLFVAGSRRVSRKARSASADLVWDAFGRRSA
jgi:hypothetical protein